MKNLWALSLLLSSAGSMHATVVYATYAAETPTTSVDSEDGLSFGLMNFHYLSGDYIPSDLSYRDCPIFGAPLDQSTAGVLEIACWETVRETVTTLDISSGNRSFSSPFLDNNVRDMIVQVPDSGQSGSAGSRKPRHVWNRGVRRIGLG